jgi:hypothetical protein
MLDRINALLKAAGHDKRLLPYVMRLQAARKALLAAEKVPNPAAQTSAQRLLDSIDEELGGDPLTPQQASFNAISAEVGHTPNGVATGSPVGDLGGASTASQPAADPQPHGPDGGTQDGANHHRGEGAHRQRHRDRQEVPQRVRRREHPLQGVGARLGGACQGGPAGVRPPVQVDGRSAEGVPEAAAER